MLRMTCPPFTSRASRDNTVITMSLKAVHLVFVAALSGLAFGLGLWKLQDYRAPVGAASDLLLALAAFVGGLVVIAYGAYVLKKLKAVSYL